MPPKEWGGAARAPMVKGKKKKGDLAVSDEPVPIDISGLNLKLKLLHAHGVGASNAELLAIPDESGVARDHVLYEAGQSLALLRLDDQRMCFMEGANSKTAKPGSSRSVVNISVSPNRKHVAVCERVVEVSDPSIVSHGPLPKGQSGSGGDAIDSGSSEPQYFVSIHRNVTASLAWPKITLSVPTIFPAPPRFTCLAWSADSKLLAAAADGESEDDKNARSAAAAAAAALAGLGPGVGAGAATSSEPVNPAFSLVVWEWAKDKVVASTRAEGVGRDKVECSKLSFCPTDKNCLVSSGLCSLKQWSVQASGVGVESRSLLPPNKATENFVAHAWMNGKPTGHEAPDKRLVVVTDGAPPNGGGGGGGGGNPMALAAAAPLTPGSAANHPSGGGGSGMFGAHGRGTSRASTSHRSLHSSSSHSSGANKPREFQLFVFDFTEDMPPVLELVKSFAVPLPTLSVHSLAPYGKGFVLAGSEGFFQVWDRTDSGSSNQGGSGAELFTCVKTLPEVSLSSAALLLRRQSSESQSAGSGARGSNGGGGGVVAGSGSMQHVASANAWSGSAASFTSLAVHPLDEVLVATTAQRELVRFPLGSLETMGDGNDDDENDENEAGNDGISSGGTGGGHSDGFSAFTRLGGAHKARITCLGGCLLRPLVATGSVDETVRVWDYTKWRGGGDVVFDCSDSGDGTPHCLSLHPAGQQLVVGFGARVRLFSLLYDDLKPLRDLPVTKCAALAYCHAGHRLAIAASSHGVAIHDSLTLQELQSYGNCGGVAGVRALSWTLNDLLLLCSGADGSVCGWELASGTKLDAASHLSAPVPCAQGALVVTSPMAAFGAKTATGGRRGGEYSSTADASEVLAAAAPVGATVAERAAAAKVANRVTCLVVSCDGSLREAQWPMLEDGAAAAAARKSKNDAASGGGDDQDQKGAAKSEEVVVRQSRPVVRAEDAVGGTQSAQHAAAVQGRSLITCVAKCPGKPFLLAGASNGMIHVYAWPLKFAKPPAAATGGGGASRRQGGSGWQGDDNGSIAGESREIDDAAALESLNSSSSDAYGGSGGGLHSRDQGLAGSDLPPHLEIPAHGCAVEHLLVTPDDAVLFSAGADGSLLVFKLDEIDEAHLQQQQLQANAHVAHSKHKAANSVARITDDQSDNDDSAAAAAVALSPTSTVAATTGAHGHHHGHHGGGPEPAWQPLCVSSLAAIQASLTSEVFENDVMQVSLEDLEERAAKAEDLQRNIASLEQEKALQLHLKEAEWDQRLKSAADEAKATLQAEQAKLASLQSEHASMMDTHAKNEARRVEQHTHHTLELESQYEQKLSLELTRYDRLSEEIEAVQQRCEALLDAQQRDHDATRHAQEAASKQREGSLKAQLEHLGEDERHAKAMFKEVLDQQEAEYEAELAALMAAAQAELAAERRSTAKMRVTAQEKQAAIDALKQKVTDLKSETHKQDANLVGLKAKNAKMESTLEHFRRHMRERESTLEGKEAGIVDLRRKNLTLDHFRFVLDHRAAQLMEERGPVADHIRSLEKHVDAMYDELEQEYASKKQKQQDLASQAMKVNTLNGELATLRSTLKTREAYIASFKRDLSALVTLKVAKDVEDAVKDAYQKYVKGERPRNKALSVAQIAGRAANGRSQRENGQEQPQQPGAGNSKKGRLLSDMLDEEYDGGGGGGGSSSGAGAGGAPSANDSELALALQEAYAQRDTAERTKHELAKKLEETKQRASSGERNKLAENSALMGECNELRSENLTLKRSVDHLRQVVKSFEAEDRQKRDAQKLAAIASRASTPQQQQQGSRPQQNALLGGGGRMGNAGIGLPGLPGQLNEGSFTSQETDPFGQISAPDNDNDSLEPPLLQQQTGGQMLMTSAAAHPTAAAWGSNQSSSRGGGGNMMSSSGGANRNNARVPPKQAAATARAGRAEVLQQNADLAAALDENERIVAMQRQELASLRSMLGGGLARQGPGRQHLNASATLQSSVREQQLRPSSAGNARARGAQLKVKKPSSGPPGGGEVGLYPDSSTNNGSSATGPFMSKAVALNGRK